MGPALVRRVDVLVDGQPVDGWTGALDRLFGPGHPYGWDRISANPVQDAVLAPGERVPMFSIPWADDARVREAFSNGARFEVRACYCSVLNDCWTTREGIDHEPVDACPVR